MRSALAALALLACTPTLEDSMSIVTHPITVSAWGDSLTNGASSWLAFLPEAWSTVNHGQSGDEWYNDIGERCRADILGGELNDVAVLFGGTNDIAAVAWDVDVTMDEVIRSADVAIAANYVTIVVMPPPRYLPDGGVEDYTSEMAQYRSALSAQYPPGSVAVLADIYTAFKDVVPGPPQDLYIKNDETNDGIHPWGQPSMRGRQLEADVIRDAIVDAYKVCHPGSVAGGCRVNAGTFR